jgi:hypothetical protein
MGQGLLLRRIMLRRTKVERADDLGLPPRVVRKPLSPLPLWGLPQCLLPLLRLLYLRCLRLRLRLRTAGLGR